MNRRELFGLTAGALIVAPVMEMMPTRFPDEIILLIDEDGLVSEMWTPPPGEYFLSMEELWKQQIRFIAHRYQIPRRMLNG